MEEVRTVSMVHPDLISQYQCDISGWVWLWDLCNTLPKLSVLSSLSSPAGLLVLEAAFPHVLMSDPPTLTPPPSPHPRILRVEGRLCLLRPAVHALSPPPTAPALYSLHTELGPPSSDQCHSVLLSQTSSGDPAVALQHSRSLDLPLYSS